jgi:1,4-dihydroxy-2-naphthoyl-CoA hydrolase
MTSAPARSGMPGHFGIRIVEADKHKLVGELDADDRHLNNSGRVHGGALAAFADDLGGALAGLNVEPGFRTTTIESKTNIFRACEPGRLTGIAVPVHVGRRTIVLQTSIYRADGKLAAMMIQTQMVLPRRPVATAGEGLDRVEMAKAKQANVAGAV